MARAVGKRVATGISAFDSILERISFKEELEIDVSHVCFNDINDKKIFLSDFIGKILLLIGGGQGATEKSKKWEEILEKEYSTCKDVMIAGIAIIGKLPPFVHKSFVKAKVKKTKGITPFIDWDGNSVNVLGITDTITPHIFLIDKQGILRFRLVENYSERGLDELKRQIEKWTQ